MTDALIDLNPYRPHGFLGKRYAATTTCVGYVNASLGKHGANTEPPTLFMCLASALHQFLLTDYMQQSPWFQSQPAHCIHDAIVLRNAERIVVAAMDLHLLSTTDDWILASPPELPLNEEYHVQRLIAETVLECV